MSNEAKQLIAEALENNPDGLQFEHLVRDLDDQLDVQQKTIKTYIYQYAQSEDSGGSKWVAQMKPEHMDATVSASAEDAGLTEGTFEATDEIPPAVGKTFHEMEIRQPGHPKVPSTGEYIKRPMGGDDVEVDFNQNVTFIEALTKAISVPDFPVLVIGEPGVGKSYSIKHACDQTNTPHDRVNAGTGIRKEQLVGGFVPKGNGDKLETELEKAEELASNTANLTVADALEAIGSRDQFEWQDGLLTQRVRNGGVFQMDELNAAPPEATMALHGLLEDGDNRSLELMEKGEVITPHEDFRFVATQNPSTFAGTHQMNEAFETRFIPIDCPALGPRAEKGLLVDTTDLSKSEADELVEMALDLRSDDNAPPCSFRQLKQIAAMKDTMGIEGATRMILLSNLTSDTASSAVNKRLNMVNF